MTPGDEQVAPPGPHRPSSALAKAHTRMYIRYTYTRQVQAIPYSGYTRTGRALQKCTYTRKSTKVHQYTYKLKHQYTLTRCTVKVVYTKHCTSISTQGILRALLRLFKPNFVQAQVQCVRTSTSSHIHYVRHSGYPCRILYTYTYRVHAQSRGITYNRCIAQAAHAKHCARTRTVCTPKHAGLRRIGKLLKLLMPNTVHVYVQSARLRARTHAK